MKFYKYISSIVFFTILIFICIYCESNRIQIENLETTQPMKIAILFSGRININKEIHNNFLTNCVQNHEIDIFISHNKTNNKKVIESFKNLYKPIIITENNETYINLDKYPTIKENTRRTSMLYMYENRNNVWNKFEEYVKKTNKKYDLIVSTRNDLWFNDKIDYKSLKQMVDKNYICIPNPEFDFPTSLGGINDHYAIGNYDTISIYLKLYKSLIELLDSGVTLHPETLLFVYLTKQKLEIHRFLIDYKIFRDVNNEEQT